MQKLASHTIRLHGPWQYSVITCSAGGPVAEQNQSGILKIPSDWGGTLGGDFRGRVRYSRSFGKPTGLNSHDRVELVVSCIDAFGDVSLNDALLGKIPPGLAATRFDITQLLVTRNQLIVEVELPAESGLQRAGREGLAGGIIGEVRLEIFAGTEN